VSPARFFSNLVGVFENDCLKEITGKTISYKVFFDLVGMLENVSLKVIPTRFGKKPCRITNTNNVKQRLKRPRKYSN
jgi:hypothetical protein